MAAYEIPLAGQNETFQVTLAGVTYTFTVIWREMPAVVTKLPSGWFLDIADAAGNKLVSGLPLVTGCDLLAQFGYLNIGGALIVQTDNSPDTPPTFDNLGTTSHLYWVPNG